MLFDENDEDDPEDDCLKPTSSKLTTPSAIELISAAAVASAATASASAIITGTKSTLNETANVALAEFNKSISNVLNSPFASATQPMVYSSSSQASSSHPVVYAR